MRVFPFNTYKSGKIPPIQYTLYWVALNGQYYFVARLLNSISIRIFRIEANAFKEK
jgi:hypothetical protein